VVRTLWPDHFHAWHGTVLPWAAAMAMVLAAGFLLGPAEGSEAGDGGAAEGEGPAWALPDVPPRLEALLLVGIALLAAFVRLHRIGSIPAGIYVDETNGALDALQILEGRDDSPFGVGWYGTPSGYAYYMAVLFKLFGASWGTLKAASLLPAFLTVLALYPLGRLMFGPAAGLSATAILAVNRWHMSMSRWGWNEVAPPLFQIVATFFLLRGLRDRRPSDFALGGLVGGLMMYTYLSSRLALATLGAFALCYLLTAPEGPAAAWRRHRRGLLLFLAAWGVAVAPIAVTHLRDPFSFSNRVSEISVFRDVKETGSYRPLGQNVVDHLRVFHQVGDHQGKHNLPDEPQVDPVVGLLFALGLAHALFRLRDPRRSLLWLWLLFGMAGGVFSSHHESPQSYRTLTAMPAVALIAGEALARLAGAAAGRRGAAGAERSAGGSTPRPARVAAAIVAAALAASALWETRVYFGPQASSLAVIGGFNPVENGVARDVLAALGKGTRPYLSPRFYWYSPLRFLVWGKFRALSPKDPLNLPPWREVRFEQDLPLPPEAGGATLLVDASYLPVLGPLRHFYPGAKVEKVFFPDGGLMYLRIVLSEEEMRATGGLARSSAAGERVVPTVDGTSAADGGRVRWDGAVRVERTGPYDLHAPPGVALTVDGAAWEGKRLLGSGLHAFHAEAAGAAGPGGRLEWTRPDGTREEVPPRLLFRVRPPRNGFRTFYYANSRWEGPPLYECLTPILLLNWMEPEPVPTTSEFSARFLATLRVEKPGSYRFRADADDGATLLVDGREVGEVVINARNTFPATVELTAGEHLLEVRYFQLGGADSLSFFWQPPGEPEALIPPELLTPAAPAPPPLR
jgi:hypothetical protein